MKLLAPVKRLVHTFGRAYIREICRRERKNQSFQGVNERPAEYQFVLNTLLKTSPRTVLDVGTGDTALPSLLAHCGCLVDAVDNIRDYWVNDCWNRHFVVDDLDITDRVPEKRYDLITCISVLEHIRKSTQAVANLLAALASGGSLVLTFPYSEPRYIPNTYDLPTSFRGKGVPFICQSYSRQQLDEWFREWRIVEQEYWYMMTGEFWGCGELVNPPIQVGREDLHHLTCLRVTAA